MKQVKRICIRQPHMLEIKGLHYRPATSEEEVLSGVSFQARCGQPVVVSGASGSGKTSLVEVISGLASPEKGEILWREKAISDRQRRWLCGVVFQFPERYFLGLTVAQELRLGHRRLSNELQTDVIKRVGLRATDLKQAPEKLSGGQQRRLALAVQLLRKPKVLLLDEPTAGLDWSVRDEILKLLTNLAKDQVLIVVTHEPEIFQGWSSSEYELSKGQLQKMSTLN